MGPAFAELLQNCDRWIEGRWFRAKTGPGGVVKIELEEVRCSVSVVHTYCDPCLDTRMGSEVLFAVRLNNLSC